MKRWILTIVAVLATVLALTATAVAVGPDREDGRRPDAMMQGPMNGRMHGSMAGPMGPGHHGMMQVASELEYLVEMIAHHQEAVDAAGELARSRRPRMRAFGAAIVASQSAQIELMEGWLEEWYAGEDTEADYEPMMRDLTRLSGNRLDRVFLQDMVHHHMMAVMMSQQLLMRGLADHDEVARLAEDIRDEQRREIVQMRTWLARWFDVGPGPCPMRDGSMGHGPGHGPMGHGPMGHGPGHGPMSGPMMR